MPRTLTSIDGAELKMILVPEARGLLGVVKAELVTIDTLVTGGGVVADVLGPEAVRFEAGTVTVTVQAEELPVTAVETVVMVPVMVNGVEVVATDVTDVPLRTVFWRTFKTAEARAVSVDNEEVCSVTDVVGTEVVRTLVDGIGAVVPPRVVSGPDTVTITQVGWFSVAAEACVPAWMEVAKVNETVVDLTTRNGSISRRQWSDHRRTTILPEEWLLL
ncbi:hypothetical protein J132_04043 [Termitomyces sp. J132]|nr:hypothetical protein J132_04043 [Termitomyces sp. J132]